ncbi:MAG: EAL domain-containing protein [Oleiphilaceae bacterium]|nr:EAL domain-containing protein [Oleiphilaceae bacterium]
MTATAALQSARGTPVIALGITNSANARLMTRVLGGHYPLLQDLGQLEARTPDLLILDEAMLQRHRELIQRLRRQHEPMVLPVLMVSELRASPRNGNSELGHTVDDILRIPSTRQELLARIGNLLRLRHLSREQDNARRDLAAMVSALRTFNDCDQVMVRARNESELLKSFCQSIISKGTYQLAWVCFCQENNDGPPSVHARAGRAAGCAEGMVADWQARLDRQQADSREKPDKRQQVQVLNHLAEELHAMPGHQGALDQGLASALLMTLNTDIGATGYLALYSDRPDHFSQEECRLMDHMATNLSHTLNTLRFQQERENQSAQIQKLAFSDALTGLPNRRYLISFLDDLLARSEPRDSPSAAILFVDLDGFKPINDVFGHETGDQVLVQVAQRLSHTVRDSDLVIRHGGDEFLVVLFDNPRNQPRQPSGDSCGFARMAEDLANRLIQSIQSPMMVNDQEHRLGASIGISLCPDHGQDASAVIQAADNAMYDAKRSGGGCCHLYSPQMLEKRLQRLSMEAQLRQAIEREGLELHFQPIFDLASLRITGTEALARWPLENGEMVMPGDFIPVAEETGLIVPLGNWALTAAARQLQQWHRDGHPLRMAVNLSVQQLHPHGDANHLAALVRPYVDPEWITLEITESIIMVDPVAIEALLHQLRNHGFKIAIDDFGTGYSSLSRLQHLPLQTLKIDRSFVNQMDEEGKGRAMIPIIQQMASSFTLHTVAEGIETESQYQQLLSAGIDSGQGYWFSRPLPEASFRQLLDAPFTDPRKDS